MDPRSACFPGAHSLTVATIGLRRVTSRFFRMRCLDLFGRPPSARTPAPCSLSNHGCRQNDEVLPPRSSNLECNRCNRLCRSGVGRSTFRRCPPGAGNKRGHSGPLPTAFQPILAPQYEWLCPTHRGRCGGGGLPKGQLRRRRSGAEARAQSVADSCSCNRVGALPVDVRRPMAEGARPAPSATTPARAVLCPASGVPHEWSRTSASVGRAAAWRWRS